jgi:hypothetical protein
VRELGNRKEKVQRHAGRRRGVDARKSSGTLAVDVEVDEDKSRGTLAIDGDIDAESPGVSLAVDNELTRLSPADAGHRR